MRSLIRTLGIGVASTALVLTAPAAVQASGHHDNGDTSIDEIVDPGTFEEDEEETAVITIEYTCPDDADAQLTVWLKQKQDDNRHHGHHSRGGHDDDEIVRGSETLYEDDLDCTDESEEVDVEVEADDDAEWEERCVKVKALIVSKDDHDIEKDFEHEHIKLEED